MLRILAGATLLGLAHGAGKCVNRDGAGAWTTDGGVTAASDCAAAGDQWIGEHAQEGYYGSSPKRKTWWTKRMTAGTGKTSDADANPPGYDRLFFGGQPSERDLKMLYEQGFDAVYSLWPFPVAGEGKEIEAADDGSFPTGRSAMPTGTEAAAVAAEAGLLYGIIDTLPASDAATCSAGSPAADAVVADTTPEYAWNSAESVDQIEAFIDFALAETDGAIYLHCFIGRTASWALQAYRLRKAAKLAAGTACGVDPCPALVAQDGKSLTQTAVLEAGYHGFDISRPAWYAGLAREAGETYTAAADLVAEVAEVTESCADDPDIEGTADCATGFTSSCEDTCPTGCIYTAGVAAANEVPAVTEDVGTAGAIPNVAFPDGDLVSSAGSAYGLAQYHWLKVLGRLDNTILYDAGQVHLEHIDAIKRAGVTVVVNMRKAVAQEETNLINVKSSAKTSNTVVTAIEETTCMSTADTTLTCETEVDLAAADAETLCTDASCTYQAAREAVVKSRQDATWLADSTADTGGSGHVVDTARPNEWAGSADVNFEVLNEHEFGDSVGYNEATEAAAWAAAGVEYYSLPVGEGVGYDSAGLVEYADELIAAINTATAAGKHVLFHCRTGYRTGAYPSALLAAVGADTSDAISGRMASLGYDDAGDIGTLMDAVDEVQFVGSVDGGTITGDVCLASAEACPEVVEEEADEPKTSGATVVSAAASLLLATLFA